MCRKVAMQKQPSAQNTKHLFPFHIIFQLTRCNADARTIPSYEKKKESTFNSNCAQSKTQLPSAAAASDKASVDPSELKKHFNRRETKAFQNKKDSFICSVGWDPTQHSALPLLFRKGGKKVTLRTDFNCQILQYWMVTRQQNWTRQREERHMMHQRCHFDEYSASPVIGPHATLGDLPIPPYFFMTIYPQSPKVSGRPLVGFQRLKCGNSSPLKPQLEFSRN